MFSRFERHRAASYGAAAVPSKPMCRRPGATSSLLSCRPNQPRIVCRQRRYIDQVIPPVYPRFGLPIVYEAAQWQPIDHTIAIGETLEAATLQQRRKVIGVSRHHDPEP